MEKFDFFTQFIDVDFDNILLQNNNPLFNSDEHYFKYKRHYLDEANKNKESYEDIVDELEELQNKQLVQKTATKVIYTFVDTDRINILKQNKKNILSTQHERLQNFLHYLHQLNTDNTHVQTNRSPSNRSSKSVASIESKRSVKNNVSIISRFKKAGNKNGKK